MNGKYLVGFVAFLFVAASVFYFQQTDTQKVDAPIEVNDDDVECTGVDCDGKGQTVDDLTGDDALDFIANEYGFSVSLPTEWSVEVLAEGRPANDVGDMVFYGNDCAVNITKPTVHAYESIMSVVLQEPPHAEYAEIGSLKGRKQMRKVNSSGDGGDVGAVYSIILNDKQTIDIFLRFGVGKQECEDGFKHIAESIRP